MRTSEIGEFLRTTNGWWRTAGPSWTEVDPHLRALARSAMDYEPEPLNDLVEGALYILRGPRRVGKSVELKRAIVRLLASGVTPRRIIHVSVEGWDESDLGGLIRVGRDLETRGVVETRYWFIDEITGVRGDWPNRIKWLRDNTAFGEDCVILTGSSAKRFDDATKALAGRRGRALDSDRTLLPMTFTSFCDALDVPRPDYDSISAASLRTQEAEATYIKLQPYLNDLILAWEAYLTVGGFPRAVDDYVRDRDVAPDFLEALWAVAHGDAISTARFTAVQTQALLARLTDNLSSPVSVSRMARELSTSRTTLSARIEDLHAAYLTWPCYRSDHGMPKLRAQAKIYFADPLLARLATHRHPSTHAPDVTTLSEQQVGLALRRHAIGVRPGTDSLFDHVLYHRTPTDQEVDFVGGDLPLTPVESKYVDSQWRRAAQTMRAAFGQGIVATRSVLDLDGDAWAVPAPLLALALDGRM
jgi:uncharacterized protein